MLPDPEVARPLQRTELGGHSLAAVGYFFSPDGVDAGVVVVEDDGLDVVPAVVGMVAGVGASIQTAAATTITVATMPTSILFIGLSPQMIPGLQGCEQADGWFFRF